MNNRKAKLYTGIYSAHKYWSKKPYNIISDLIQEYSKEKDIVIDPFCGSGISVIESLKLNRKSIGIDINPVAVFITEQMIEKINVNKSINAFENIKNNIKNKIDNLYSIKRNGEIIYATHFIWEKEKIFEIWQSNIGRKKRIFKPTKEDEINSKKITLEEIPYFYPKNSFFHNSRVNTKSEQKVFDLFTNRNLYALSLLYNEIEKIKDEKIKNILKFVFTASVGQSSKMVFIINRKIKKNNNIVEKKEVGSWTIGYWKPKSFFEINVWKNFENRFKKIIKAKKKQQFTNFKIKRTKKLKNIFLKNYNLCLKNEPSQIILKNILNNSVDYVISDPPHGDRIPYLELSILWNSWLQKKVNFNDEIIVSNAKKRNKNLKNYNFLINKVYSEIYRILKPNKYFSLIFNSLDDKIWANLISYLFEIGFDLYSIDTLGYSFNSIVQNSRKMGLKTDFILTFQKKNKKNKIKILSIENNNDYLRKEIYEIVNNAKNSEFYILINKCFKYFLEKREFFKISEIITIIKELI